MAIDEFRALRAEFDFLRQRFENSRDIAEKRLTIDRVSKVMGKVITLIRKETERLDRLGRNGTRAAG